MFVSSRIQADHKDLIHDVSYDFHGRRMATCSSDQSVKIWDMGEDNQWKSTANWKAHSGSVWRVTWAHPEFGQVIATCSFDRTAVVWEELVVESGPGGGHKNWVKRSSLVDSRTSVTDVKFGPKHLGLQLATCSSDGIVRIYEAADVMNLSQWSLQHEITCKLICSCLSWNPSRLDAPMIVVGSDDPSPSSGVKVLIYEYSNRLRKWTKVEAIVAATEPVRDVKFANDLGRSYHLLAVASTDLKIFTLRPLTRGDQQSHSKFEIRQVAQFDDHRAVVWRLDWNVTGTVLASSGDDGCIRLWKGNYLDNWKCTSVVRGDGSPVRQGDQPTQGSVGPPNGVPGGATSRGGATNRQTGHAPTPGHWH